jgi:hypothetical protein
MVGMKNSRLSTAGSQLAELLVTVVTGEVDDDSKPEAACRYPRCIIL